MSEFGAVFGIGYEGRDLDAVLTELRAMRADVLVDVRLNPSSRKPGLSKTALSEAVGRAGIEYLHMKALGNPRENRAGFAQTSGELANHARDVFRSRLASSEAEEALGRLTDMARTMRVAVLCYEAREANCHRREVLQAVRVNLA